VVESLISEAARRRIVVPTIVPFKEGDDIEPVVTTVPMTPNRVVERTINDFLQNRRGMLRTWVSRGQTYFPMIEEIFAEEGVPDELKYITLGESGLNPTAGSWAGAVGMWQFMAATARSEGLRVDSWVDERRDPEKSTRAAARHLLALHESYNGRWHLALAGYNCSYRCITRAVKNSGHSMDDPPSYWDVYANLPKETRDFVPKYIASALIVSNPELYGLQVEDFGQELAYDVIHVHGMLSLEEAARLAGTDLPTIRNLNPALLRSTLPDDAEPYALKIPLGSYDHFVTAFVQAAPKAVAGEGEYLVESGDTLDRIARTHSTTVAELQAVNGIEGHLIRINQKLRIPGMGGIGNVSIASTERTAVNYGSASFRPIKLADEFQLVHQSGSKPDAPLLAVSLNLNLPEADEGAMSLVPTIYKVQSGDTLGGIARRYGVSVASIQQGNNIRNTTIFPNQELTIHSATNIVDPPQPGTLTYQVQRGDSLYEIALRFGQSVANIKRLNRLSDNLIHPGQQLFVD
jgi:membrane-bound lytic murein transglycosylase D